MSDVSQYRAELRRKKERERMPDIIKVGDTATLSGVYKAVHAEHHIPPHYITAIHGDTFPA
jgi:hypothetical protein